MTTPLVIILLILLTVMVSAILQDNDDTRFR